jgi:hypothetical protein
MSPRPGRYPLARLACCAACRKGDHSRCSGRRRLGQGAGWGECYCRQCRLAKEAESRAEKLRQAEAEELKGWSEQ